MQGEEGEGNKVKERDNERRRRVEGIIWGEQLIKFGGRKKYNQENTEVENRRERDR